MCDCMKLFSCPAAAVKQVSMATNEVAMPSACSSSGSVAAGETLASAVKLEGAKRDNAAPPRPPSSKSPERSSSPEQSCPICLGPLEDKSFAGSCFHTFCFSCLLKWSKVKAECPLCKQRFKSILHNVRSLEDYDQYFVHNNAFQASSTVRAAAAAEAMVASTSRSSPMLLTGQSRQRRHSVAQFSTGDTRSIFVRTSTPAPAPERQRLYELDLWVYLSDNWRSSRHFTPAYFRENPACAHRLIPWLNRELVALLGDNDSQITFATGLVLQLLRCYEVCSLQFALYVQYFFGTRTVHFLHELAAFIASPLDMVAYDRVAVYNYRAHVVARGTPAAVFLQTPESSLEDTSPVAPVTLGAHSDPSQPSPSGLHHNVTTNLVDLESDNSDCMIVSSVMPAVPTRSRTPIVIELSSSDEGDAERRTTAPAAVAAAVSTTPLQQPARRCKPMAGKKRLLQLWSSNSDTSTASDTDSDDGGVDRAAQRLRRRVAMRRKRSRVLPPRIAVAAPDIAASVAPSLPALPAAAAAVGDHTYTSLLGHHTCENSMRKDQTKKAVPATRGVNSSEDEY
ncbi:E3 ubiquitin-protein ligase Topors isoform X1 [Dermacentor silvarum]|uniref:E3 ubiquitin-protein ligase Topors isoform X1 n=2 Tax=Dermacentor silvarum TaxID=543639 RepID=UPI0018972E71|nr:E3 ubiquitin-protein ligase Topors isoform X1 [Dermacentor silvarum]